jgi:diguanylate cyclase (GGDEF)-like protein
LKGSPDVYLLRASFQLADFEQDDLFWKMKKWERSNPRYKLLRSWRELDPLGTVWGQRYWQKDLAALLDTLGAGAILAVLKMDLDNFKRVNEVCGHTVGDEAIRLYCSIVKKVLGIAGEIYRRGGDEVIALAPGVTEGIARELAEKTRSEIESQLHEWGTARDLNPTPTASIGLTVAGRGTLVSDIRPACRHGPKSC